MKIFSCIALSCLLLVPVSTVYAEDPFPSASRFPLKNLEEVRFALDAARGNVDAVESWLDAGKSPDIAGEIDLVYSIGKEELSRIFRTLADRGRTTAVRRPETKTGRIRRSVCSREGRIPVLNGKTGKPCFSPRAAGECFL